MKNFFLNILSIIIIVSSIVYACANRGYPQGGPKDETPPVILKEEPESFSTNFHSKRIRIHFDEYIQLKDITNKMVISPPMRKIPKVSGRGMYLQVDFEDTLKSNTTYSIDFGDAIVDNNEGNAFGFYRYVFSTGSTIDSLELSGKVVDAETQLPLLGMIVMLYENHADSASLKELPDYIARTDSSGVFVATNLKNTTYRVMVVEDENRDIMFTPEVERVGFVDSLVTPLMWRETRADTIWPDTTVHVKISRREKKVEAAVNVVDTMSIVEREYILYGPTNLYMSMFKESSTQLYMLNEGRPEREKLIFIFSIPADNQLQVRLLDVDSLISEDFEDWYLRESSAGKDSITLWIRDSMIYKMDSLRAELTYLWADSLRRIVPHTDTVRFIFKEKTESTGRRRAKKEEDKPKIELLKYQIDIGSPHDLNRDIVLNFDTPIDLSQLDAIQLFEKIDTTWLEVERLFSRDSVKLRRFYIKYPWKSDTDYQLKIDSMTIFDIYGNHNSSFEKTFKTRDIETYGNLIINIKNSEMPVILQVYQGDDVKVVREAWLENGGTYKFDYMVPGVYMVRAIMDRNGNKKWDTGHFLKRIQPEEIKYLPVEFEIKEYRDIEQDFDVSATYVREDPKKKKSNEQVKDKSRDKR